MINELSIADCRFSVANNVEIRPIDNRQSAIGNQEAVIAHHNGVS
jgi:hypothetical protein